MEQNKLGFHKSLFGGYRKSDIMEYVQQTTTALTDKETFANVKIAELTSQMEALQEENQALQAKLTQTQEAAKSSHFEWQKLNILNQNLQAQLEEAKGELSQNIQALQEEQGKCRQLAEDLDSVREKSQKYDQFHEQIGDIVVNAHAYAQNVMESAKKEAADLTGNSARQLEQLSGNVISINDDIGAMGGKINNYVTQINSLLSVLVEEIDQAASQLHPRFAGSADFISNQAEPADFFSTVFSEEDGRSAVHRPKILTDFN